jgi:methionyl-tRNA formyltransferase
MTILLVGPRRSRLADYLRSIGDDVRWTEDRITSRSPVLEGSEFIISYGYRHILKKGVLARFARRIVNLHISLLPYNRGADPNLWSFLEDTPKGVTIHYIDEGIDTGDILAQREVSYHPGDTLRTSYDRLSATIVELFCEVWPEIRSGQRRAVPQPKGGTCDRLRDRGLFSHLLTRGWDTPVSELVGKALSTPIGVGR